MIDERFTILGSIIAMIGGLSYLIATIKGRVKPNKVSFLLWSFAPLIAFTAQIKEGVGFLLALITFVAGIEPFLIFVASFLNKKAEWKLNRFDLACGAVAVLGLILWQITKTGNIAIGFSILAEIAWPWLATSIGVVLTLLTLTGLTFANSSFIIYLLIVNFIIFSLIQFRVGEKLGFTEK